MIRIMPAVYHRNTFLSKQTHLLTENPIGKVRNHNETFGFVEFECFLVTQGNFIERSYDKIVFRLFKGKIISSFQKELRNDSKCKFM